MPTSTLLLGLSLLLATCFPHDVRAEVVNLEGEEVPRAWSLRAQRVFYVYGEEDSVGSFKGGAQVTFKNVGFKADAKQEGRNATRTNNIRLYVGLLPYSTFKEQVDPMNFCDSLGSFALGRTPGQKEPSGHQSLVHESLHLLEDAKSTAVVKEQKLSKTGVYLLFSVNCGGSNDFVTTTGSVSIQNAWGQLSPLDYYKGHFYGFLAAIYALVCSAWLALTFGRWKQLYPFQKGLAMTVFLATLEALLWCTFFTAENAWGVEHESLRLLLDLLSGYKLCVMLQMVQRLEEGFSDKCADESSSMHEKNGFLLMSFLAFFVFMRTTMHYQHMKLLKMSFVLLSCAPAAGTGTILCFLAACPSARVQLDKYQQALLARTQGVVLLAQFVGMLVVGMQLVDPTSSTDRSYFWKFHYMVSDVLPQVGFLIGLLLLLLVWCPAEGSQGYKYDVAAVQEGDVVGKKEGIWSDDDCEEAATTRARRAGDAESGALD